MINDFKIRRLAALAFAVSQLFVTQSANSETTDTGYKNRILFNVSAAEATIRADAGNHPSNGNIVRKLRSNDQQSSALLIGKYWVDQNRHSLFAEVPLLVRQKDKSGKIDSEEYIQKALLLISDTIEDGSAHYKEAEKLLSRAIALRPTYRAYIHRGSLRWNYLEKRMDGFMDFKKAQSLKPLNGSDAARFADMYIELGKKKEAIAFVNKYLTEHQKAMLPTGAEAMSDMLISLGELERALQILNYAISIHPNHSQLVFKRSTLRKRLGDKLGAIADFKRASKSDWDANAEHEILELIREKEGQDGVIAYWDSMIGRRPQIDSYFYYRRADAKKELGDLNGFYSDSIRSFELSDKDPLDYVSLSDAMRDNGDSAGALRQLKIAEEKLATENSYDPGKYLMFSYQLSKLADSNGALRILNMAIERFPTEPQVYSTRAQLREYTFKDLVGSTNDSKMAVELSNYDRIYVIDLAWKVMGRNKTRSKQDLQKGLEIYDTAIVRRPREGSHYFDRSEIKIELGDLYGALADLNKAVAIDNRHHIDRARVHLLLGDKNKAATDINLAIDLLRSDDISETIDLAEILHSELANTQDAIALLTKGAQVNRNDAWVSRIYETLASIKLDTDDILGACKEQRKAVKIDSELSKTLRGIIKYDTQLECD